MMMASNHRLWPVVRWALYGLVGGIVLGATLTALKGNLDDSLILISAIVSGGGLGVVLATLLASLRNFVRGAM